MNTPTPTPRTDTEITFTGTYTCTHHNDAERTACPVCLVAALTAERDHWQEIAKTASAEREHNANVAQAMTAERDQLRAALALGQENCDAVYDELRGDCDELSGDVVRLTARAERAEAELTAAKERLRSEAMDDYASIKNLQRELATERKKVRVLREALGNVKNSICRDIPDGYSQSYVDQSADECDKIIDAAMKEGAK
jgi:hypothetical protein